MIDEDRTMQLYGYTSDMLSFKSNKSIIVICEECGKYRNIRKSSYRDLCYLCSHTNTNINIHKKITQEFVQYLFTYKNGELFWKNINSYCYTQKNNDKAGGINNQGYYSVTINNKSYKIHQIIFLYHHGYIPEELDHIDRNKGNNNIENLRKVTRSQNMMNRKPNKIGISKYKGITWNKQLQKWSARIGINNERKFLGYFTHEIEAAKAYNKKAIELFGEYAYLNKIGGD